MTLEDLVGWLAAALTLLSFSMRSMVKLRMAAICANLCFLGYGGLHGLYPVIGLHALLLPCNLLRLCELCGGTWWSALFAPHGSSYLRRRRAEVPTKAPIV